jgi:hypothetical protein
MVAAESQYYNLYADMHGRRLSQRGEGNINIFSCLYLEEAIGKLYWFFILMQLGTNYRALGDVGSSILAT